MFYSAALLPLSMLPSLVGVTNLLYVWIAFVLGGALLALSLQFSQQLTDRAALLLFFGSIAYLPLIWGARVLDH